MAATGLEAESFDQEEGKARDIQIEIVPTRHLSFSEGAIRAGFVRKVYSILTVQLILTAAIAWPISQNYVWAQQNRTLCEVAMIFSLVLVLSVSCCCQEVARKFPLNYLFLFVVTACEAVVVGFICAMYQTESVLLAAGMTAGIFFGLTAYACITKTDYTGMGGYLYAALLGLIIASFVCMFFPYSPMMDKILSGFGAILFSMYIVYDTQLIVGHGHKEQFGVDDYVFAALNIYLDIINLFLYLLSLFGERR